MTQQLHPREKVRLPLFARAVNSCFFTPPPTPLKPLPPILPSFHLNRISPNLLFVLSVFLSKVVTHSTPTLVVFAP